MDACIQIFKMHMRPRRIILKPFHALKSAIKTQIHVYNHSYKFFCETHCHDMSNPCAKIFYNPFHEYYTLEGKHAYQHFINIETAHVKLIF